MSNDFKNSIACGVEYALCVCKPGQLASQVLGIYSTEETARAKKRMEENNLIRLGYSSLALKFHIEEIKVFMSRSESEAPVTKHVIPNAPRRGRY